MYSTDYNNLVKALDKDLERISFKQIHKFPFTDEVNFVAFDYAGRYTIEVRLKNYDTSMWYRQPDGTYNLMLTSSIDEELASIGKKLIERDFKKILNESAL